MDQALSGKRARVSVKWRIIGTMAEQNWDSIGDLRVISPSTKSTRIFLVVFGLMTAIGALVTQATIAHGVQTMAATNVLGIGLIMLVFGALFLLALLIWSVNSRLFIGRGKVGYRTIFRRRRQWSRGEISRVLDLAIDYGWTSQPQRALYFLGQEGQRLFTLTPRMWHASDLSEFVDASGAPVDRREAPARAKALKRDYPNAFRWDGQNLALATLMTVAIAVVLVIVLYVFLFVVPR